MIANERYPEATRNRLLRRVDWRFLLPDPLPARSVCFTSGPLADAVGAISGELVPPGARRCDLAVVVDPTPPTLRAAWEALRPGGWCYAEWRGLAFRGPSAIRNRLREADFESVTCYAPRPDPARQPTHVWVSLDSTAAVRHFVSAAADSPNPLLRMGRAARRGLWLAHPAARVTYPICTIAQRPWNTAPHPSPEPAAPALADTIRMRWSEWGLPGDTEGLGLLLLTGGQRSINKIVALACADSADEPQVAVKIARTPEAAAGLAREARVLAALATREVDSLKIPRLLWYECRAGTALLAETAIAGTLFQRALHHASLQERAAQVTDWQIDFARATLTERSAARRNPLVDAAVADFRAMYGGAVDPALLREATRVLATLGPLPTVCEQRDFAPWNLLLTPAGELAVLDWESAEVHGLPALDLIYFFTYAGLLLDDALTTHEYTASYSASWSRATPGGAVAHACLSRYAEAVGISTTALHPLRVLCWMLHARSDHARLRADANGRPAPEMLRSTVSVRLLQEELRYGA